MSQKQAKGRKKGKDDNIKDSGNEWEGYKGMWMECGNDECEVWVQIKAPDGWSGEKDEFRCGVCMVKEMMNLKREIEDLKTKMACMKSIDEERKEAGVYEGRESLKTWANMAKRLTNEKTIEKLERVEEDVIMKKSEIRKEVEESNYETRRKKRMIVFNLKEKKEKNDRDRVIEMIGDMGVRVREEEIVDVVRMRKKDEGGSIRPIIVEFRTEYDKWTVLRNKSDLREMTDYRSVFLEQDVSREEREKRRVMIQERKAEWELRGKMDQSRKHGEKKSQP